VEKGIEKNKVLPEPNRS